MFGADYQAASEDEEVFSSSSILLVDGQQGIAAIKNVDDLQHLCLADTIEYPG